MALTQTEQQVAPPATTTGPGGHAQQSVGLEISIRTGTGSGRTLLSAFDRALLGAGVGDFNLVTLSSVIPTASRVTHVDGVLPGGHGDLLYCVRAEAFADQPGDVAWAGLGWVTDESGGGLFVEHHGHSEASVVEQIEHSLGDMNRNRGGGYGQVQMTLASAECVGEPVCALVLAAYRVAAWDDPGQPRRPPRGAGHEHRDDREQLVELPPAASPTPASGPGGVHTAVIERWAGDQEVRASSRAGERRPAPARGAVARVSVEKEVDYVTAKRYYDLYVQTFGALDTLAAGRQLLHEEEFLAEMLDPRVHKFVAWDAEDVAIGMTTLTTDLETVPWVSPTYFAHHYPEHTARGAVYYLGFTLVHPDHQGVHVFHAMLEAMADKVIANRGIVGYDMCLVNDERGVGGSAARMLSRFADITVEPIDRQNYYTMTFHGPREKPTGEERSP